MDCPACRKNDARIKPFNLAQVPSWSWAFTNSCVVFATGSFFFAPGNVERDARVVETYFTVIASQCTLATSDSTVQVQDGHLVAQGRIFNGFMGLETITQGDANVEACVLRIQGDRYLCFATDNYLLNQKERSRFYLDAGNDFRFGLGQIVSDGCNVVCLPLARVQRRRLLLSQDTPTNDDTYAMVLAPSGENENEYKRIGMAVTHTKRESEADLGKIASWWDWGKSAQVHMGTDATIMII